MPGRESPVLQQRVVSGLRLVKKLPPQGQWVGDGEGCWGNGGAEVGLGSSCSGRGHNAVCGVEGGEGTVTPERCPPAAPPGAPGLLRQPGLPPGTPEPGRAWLRWPCAHAPWWGTRPGHGPASSRWLGAALTSAMSRAVSWEKSVHGASLPWQCNLLRASKSHIASPVAMGSGPGMAGMAMGTYSRMSWHGMCCQGVGAGEPGCGGLAHARVCAQAGVGTDACVTPAQGTATCESTQACRCTCVYSGIQVCVCGQFVFEWLPVCVGTCGYLSGHVQVCTQCQRVLTLWECVLL